MAGGPNAAATMCIHCTGKANRVSEGLENDYYRCELCGAQFGIDWSEGNHPHRDGLRPPRSWLRRGSIGRRVRKGKLTTINEIRACLARRHSATIACPIVTGIYARIAAGAAGEAEAEGAVRVTPYWRTLKAGGELNEKYPGGLSAQRRRLESEGLRVEARGRRWFVRDHTRFLSRLP